MPTGTPKNGINKGWFKKGDVSWDKDIKRPPFSEECIRKMKEAAKGKKLSEPHKEKMRESAINRWKDLDKRIEQSKKQKGKNGSNWKDGITPENKRVRHSIEMRLWVQAVFVRDNFTCQKYGLRGGQLVAHHIQNFSKSPELRFAIDNGITLSRIAHKEFHHIYGNRNNTKEQIEEFLK